MAEAGEFEPLSALENLVSSKNIENEVSNDEPFQCDLLTETTKSSNNNSENNDLHSEDHVINGFPNSSLSETDLHFNDSSHIENSTETVIENGISLEKNSTEAEEKTNNISFDEENKTIVNTNNSFEPVNGNMDNFSLHLGDDSGMEEKESHFESNLCDHLHDETHEQNFIAKESNDSYTVTNTEQQQEELMENIKNVIDFPDEEAAAEVPEQHDNIDGTSTEIPLQENDSTPVDKSCEEPMSCDDSMAMSFNEKFNSNDANELDLEAADNPSDQTVPTSYEMQSLVPSADQKMEEMQCSDQITVTSDPLAIPASVIEEPAVALPSDHKPSAHDHQFINQIERETTVTASGQASDESVQNSTRESPQLPTPSSGNDGNLSTPAVASASAANSDCSDNGHSGDSSCDNSNGEGKVTVGRGDAGVEEFNWENVTCVYCDSLVVENEPKLLPCLHSACNRCITNEASQPLSKDEDIVPGKLFYLSLFVATSYALFRKHDC